MLRTDTLHITPEILNLIAMIDEFKGAWRALGTVAPDRLSALRRVARARKTCSGIMTIRYVARYENIINTIVLLF